MNVGAVGSTMGQATEMTTLHLATDADLRPVDHCYRAAYATQAERLGEALGSLGGDQWRTPSRNAAWTVHQTMQHVAGVRLENERGLDGLEPTWSANFDPNRSPQEDVDSRAGESPEETLEGFGRATRRLLEQWATEADDRRLGPTVWGDEADFRVIRVHIFWDAFVHERDMFLPLGIEPTPDADEVALAVGYGLLIASVGARAGGAVSDVRVAVPDLGSVHLQITGERIGVTVESGERATGDLSATSAGDLVDALSGRGTLADVLDGPSEVVEALSGFGRFLSGS